MDRAPPPRPDDDNFHDVDAARLPGSKTMIIILHVLIIALIAAFLIWAHFAPVDQLARAPGQVIPSAETTVIRHDKGGIISEVLVEEGATVDRDQVIVRIATGGPGTDLRPLHRDSLRLRAMEARLTAEAQGKSPVFPPDLQKLAPETVGQQRKAFDTGAMAFDKANEAKLRELDLQQQQLKQTQERLAAHKRSLQLVEEEITITRPRVAQEIIPKANLDLLTQEAARLTSQLRQAQDEMAPIAAGVDRLRGELEQARQARQAQAREALNQVKAELAALAEQIAQQQDDARLNVMRAPFRGIVRRLPATTVGAAVMPGGAVAELAPLEDSVVIQARVHPRHLGRLRPGMPATIRLAVYDLIPSAGLLGQVDRIGDAPLDAGNGTGQEFPVLLRAPRQAVAMDGAPLPVAPGMVAQVDILIGRQSVLDHLLHPLLGTGRQVLGEW